MTDERLAQAKRRLWDSITLVHLNADLLRAYQRYGHLNAASEARTALIESRTLLLRAAADFDQLQRSTASMD